MWHQDRLQLDVSLIAHPLRNEAEEPLVGVVTKPLEKVGHIERVLQGAVEAQRASAAAAAKVPHYPPRPRVEVILPDDQCRGAAANTGVSVISHTNEVLERPV